jgi:hypothetical protein
LDLQLNAAVSLLCRPRFSHEEDRRFFRLEFDWLPPGCKVDVFYEENWEKVYTGRSPMKGTFTITPDGPVGDSPTLSMVRFKPNSSAYVIGPAGKGGDPIVEIDGRVYAPDGLKKLTAGVFLEINSGHY